jgi:hypothetical protein
MSEEITKSSAGQGLGIAGLIVGIIALIISFIPCLGMFALIPGIIALILSGIGVMIATKKNGAKGITIAALVISALACGIAGYQTKIIIDATKGARENAAQMNIKYHSCEELIIAYTNTVNELTDLEESIQSGIANTEIMGAIKGSVTKATLIGKVINIQNQAAEMTCTEDENYKARLEEVNSKYNEVNGTE